MTGKVYTMSLCNYELMMINTAQYSPALSCHSSTSCSFGTCSQFCLWSSWKWLRLCGNDLIPGFSATGSKIPCFIIRWRQWNKSHCCCYKLVKRTTRIVNINALILIETNLKNAQKFTSIQNIYRKFNKGIKVPIKLKLMTNCANKTS